MTSIQRIRLQGFKSFAKLTELEFPTGFSCILGANGSGKSNVSDAICFVLGKSSAKEMRAERSSHLIYNGGKKGSPAKEAMVEIFFDNSKKEFPIPEEIMKITRIVRHSGQSIYKINDKTMTRQQIIDLLNGARIDPDGHNIVLQGDIVRFMEMKPVERRQMIEDISGISVYEDKKMKSLSELQKVDERLKEADIILTEREVNLRELKKERDEAIKYKELEDKIRDNKATYINLQIKEKEKKREEIEKKIKEQEEKIGKINEENKNARNVIIKNREEIKSINEEIEKKSDKEQNEIRKNIEFSKTELARLKERLNVCKNELVKIDSRKKQLKLETGDITEKIKVLKGQKIAIENKIKSIEAEESKLLSSINKLKDKNEELAKARLKSVSFKELTGDLAVQKILGLKEDGIYGTVSQLGKADSKYALALEVAAGNRLKSIVVENDLLASDCIKILKESKLGVATFLPLNKIRSRDVEPEIKELSKKTEGLAIDLIKFDSKYKNAFAYVFGNTLVVKDIETARRIGIGRVRMVTLEGDLIEQSGAMIGGFRKRLGSFKEDSFDLDKLEKEIRELKEDIFKLEDKKLTNDRLIIELNGDIKNIDMQVNSMLMPETSKTEKILQEHEKERVQFENELKSLNEKIKQYEDNLKREEINEKEFGIRFRDLINKRNKLTVGNQKLEESIFKEDDKIKAFENTYNNHSIARAKVVAETEALQKEFEPFKDGKIKTGLSLEQLRVMIQEDERIFKSIGNVNLRALEIYENIEKEYKILVEKADKLKLEKDDVLRMIAEIEGQKKESFLKTYNVINEHFKNIFASLSTKGEAHMELEDQETVFNGGVDIKVKLTGTRFLDIHGLSGGEKTLAALSFIFAIQEHEPASFYLFDEVDAALDKINSEKLSKLIKKYSDRAQYIVISHNDEVITSADQIYGVSMQDGVTKVVSLKI